MTKKKVREKLELFPHEMQSYEPFQ